MKFIIFFLFLKQVFSSDSSYCDINQECSSCEKCWVIKNNNYCSCSFHNAFCYNKTLISYIYNTSFLYKYENNKCSSENINSLCGKADISKEINNDNFYKFFSFNNPDYLDNHNLLCHYSLTNDDEKSKEDLIIEVEVHLNKQNIKVTENGKNLLFIFLQDYTSLSKNVYVINLNEFKDNKYTLKVAEYKYISMYISLIQNNDFFSDNEIISLNLGVKKDNTRAKKLKKYKYSLIAICIICIICVTSCFILYIIRYKRNRELMRNRANIMANNLNEAGNRMNPEEKKKKLEKLFKEKLQKKKYLKKYNINESTACSICLEEFIENESLVCITPCFHIFHYNCLHNWLYTDNSNCYCPYCHYDLLSNKPITQRNIPKNNNNISDKQDKKENKKRNQPSKGDNIINNSSERVITKLKKNKNNNQIKNNENNINNTENINNNNINNTEKVNNNNKEDNDKEINEEEEEENNISFENDYNKIKRNKNIIDKKRNSEEENINIDNDINNEDKKDIKNEIKNEIKKKIKKETKNKNAENENIINNNNEDYNTNNNNNINNTNSNNYNINNNNTNDNNKNNSNE